MIVGNQSIERLSRKLYGEAVTDARLALESWILAENMLTSDMNNYFLIFQHQNERRKHPFFEIWCYYDDMPWEKVMKHDPARRKLLEIYVMDELMVLFNTREITIDTELLIKWDVRLAEPDIRGFVQNYKDGNKDIKLFCQDVPELIKFMCFINNRFKVRENSVGF